MGLLNPLYNLVSWILVRWHDLWSLILSPTSGLAWTLSIVGLVVMIRLALLPVFTRQIKAQRGLQALQPKIKEIQKKYANDKERQSQELMKLYRETGTNPLSSCLPIFLQMPFFFALFHVLNFVAKDQTVGVMTQAQVDSMSNAKLLGAPLSATFTNSDDINVKIVAAVLIVAMSATQFITQRQLMVKNMPTGVDNPLAQQQKILVYIFPVMFAVFGINFPIGVLVYWFVTNLWTMGQQLWVIRRNPVPGSPAYDEMLARRAAKEKADPALPAGGAGTAVATDTETRTGQRQQPKRAPKAKRSGTGTGPAKPAGAADPDGNDTPDTPQNPNEGA